MECGIGDAAFRAPTPSAHSRAAAPLFFFNLQSEKLFVLTGGGYTVGDGIQYIITLDVITAMRYQQHMIASFKGKEAQRLFRRERSRKLPPSIQKVAMRKLWILDAAIALSDLKVPPSNHLEALKGNRKGQHSIRINKQWRICFVWHEGHAKNVEIIDYH